MGEEEGHHILPRSIFPEYENAKENEWNLANLKFRDHLTAHWLLHKALPNSREASIALFMMCNRMPEILDEGLLEAYSHARKSLSSFFKENGRKVISRLNSDPDFISRRDARTRAMHTDPEFSRRLSRKTSEVMKDFYSKEENVLALSERMRVLNKDPSFRESVRQKQSKDGFFNKNTVAQWNRKKEVWKRAGEYYELWLKNGKPKQRNFEKLVGLDVQCLYGRFTGTMDHAGKEPWVPCEDPVWVDWVNSLPD